MKFLVFIVCLFAGRLALADVVASVRYFKPEGVSHYHLFLFRDDAMLIRQLTSPEDAHDVSPRFSKDGKTVLFNRKKGKAVQSWRIGIDGKGLRKLGDVAKEAEVAGGREIEYSLRDPGNDLKPGWEAMAGGGFRLAIPGTKDEVLLPKADISKFGDDEALPETRSFQALTIRDGASGKDVRVPTDGGVNDMSCRWMTMNGSPFLQREGLHVAFYYQHMGSTDGYRVSALDLLGKREVPLSTTNPALILPHGTRAGFFCVCQERYQALPETTKLVNCLYLDWWDKDFKRVRFSRALSLFGGASVRVEGQQQLDIPYDRYWSRGVE